MDAIIGEKLNKVGTEGKVEEVSVAFLNGKHIGLYFSAHWCPPCRGFTPHLKKVYEAVKEKHRDFEIVFVSRDRDAASFKDYFMQMPWMAIPFENSSLRDKLCSKYSINGIPALVILGPDGEVVAKNARSAVSKDAEGAQYPWAGASEEAGSVNFLLIAILIFMLLKWLNVPEMLGLKL